MRRRQLFAERECLIRQQEAVKEETDMSIQVPNSNIISDSAQPALVDKANMFLPHEKDIKKPNGTPYRAGGSKPGKGVHKKTLRR